MYRASIFTDIVKIAASVNTALKAEKAAKSTVTRKRN